MWHVALQQAIVNNQCLASQPIDLCLTLQIVPATEGSGG